MLLSTLATTLAKTFLYYWRKKLGLGKRNGISHVTWQAGAEAEIQSTPGPVRLYLEDAKCGDLQRVAEISQANFGI